MATHRRLEWLADGLDGCVRSEQRSRSDEQSGKRRRAKRREFEKQPMEWKGYKAN